MAAQNHVGGKLKVNGYFKPKSQLVGEMEDLSNRVEELLISETKQQEFETDLQGALHDLRVYQEELRTQNEQLQFAWQELEISQQKYEYLFDFAPTGYFTIDQNTLIREVNLTGAELLGYGRHYLMGKPLFLYVGPESRDSLAVHFRGVFQGIDQTIEVVLVSRTGQVFPVLLQSTLIREGIGVGQNCLTAVMDITERKRAEEQLRKLSRIVEQSPNSMMIIDVSGTIEYVNPAFTQVTKYALEEIIGQNWETLKSDEHPPEFYEQIWETVHMGQGWQGDICYRKKNGDLYWELQSISPVRNLAGQITHFAIVRIDDTERKQAEQALRESNQRLEETLTKLQETQKQIVQQERLAAVGQLAAGIAHDFNNILTGIQGYAELLQIQADMPETAQTDLEHILTQSQRAAYLIRQILDFSRKSIRQPKRLDLVSFLKETVQFLERTIPENIDIDLEVTRGEYLINADLTQLQQVLTNLAVNARDAMPMGGKLSLRLDTFTLDPDQPPPCPEMPPGRWITLLVSDTGTGIAPEIQSRIFEPFFTTKEVGQGTGLGLAQVYGIVRQHDGYIALDTRGGKGTTFNIFLPPNEVSELRPERGLVTVDLPHGNGETILLVEDEPAVLDIARTMLEYLNYRVLAAANSQAALDIYTHHKDEIALILTDMVMPQMDGIELFQVLRAKDPDVKMIMITRYPLGEKAPEVIRQGFTDWLQKPMRLLQLARVVHRALQA